MFSNFNSLKKIKRWLLQAIIMENRGGKQLLFFLDTELQRDKVKPKLGSVKETSKSTSQKKNWRYLSLETINTKKTKFFNFWKIPHYNPMGPRKSIFYSNWILDWTAHDLILLFVDSWSVLHDLSSPEKKLEVPLPDLAQ